MAGPERFLGGVDCILQVARGRFYPIFRRFENDRFRACFTLKNTTPDTP